MTTQPRAGVLNFNDVEWKCLSTDCNIDSRTLNNTYINNFKIYFKFQIFLFSLNNTKRPGYVETR